MPSAYEVPLNIHLDQNGTLIVFEERSSPISVRRCFVVVADAGEYRGHHAHRSCSQLLAVLRGQVLVSVDDGTSTKDFLLSEFDKGLMIPPMNWATQKYLTPRSILIVSCDELFDEDDYIRERAEFDNILRSTST